MTFKNFSLSGVSALFVLLSACSSGTKNSSSVADSANQKQIAASDSANKAQVSATDSANKVLTDRKKRASIFLVKSYEAGLYEVKLSQLAATNALSPDVKELAVSIAKEQANINAKMHAIAGGSNFILPLALDNDDQKKLDEVAAAKGADFDKKYIDAVEAANERAVSSYKDGYQNLPDGVTKTFAGHALSKVEDQQTMIKKVKGRIN